MVKSLSNFFYGLTQRNFVARVRCAGLDVTSLSFHKEVTKKGNPDEPLGASLSVPLYKVRWGERHL